LSHSTSNGNASSLYRVALFTGIGVNSGRQPNRGDRIEERPQRHVRFDLRQGRLVEFVSEG
jgi:hypothetical protein